MDSVRLYGNESDIRVAVIHGGPGAPGYMAPVARELSKEFGVIEPLQTKDSLVGQIEELNAQIKNHTESPVILLGSSWGATLALLYTAQFPKLISKVIICGSAVYDAQSSAKVKELRLGRMSDENFDLFNQLGEQVDTAVEDEKERMFSQMADCLLESDSVDLLTTDLEIIEFQHSINKSVWGDFKLIRDQPGELEKTFSKVNVPVLNIHGDYDPHIIEGIQPFLEGCIKDIQLVMLEKCGHYPWLERKAKDEFFNTILKEI